MAYRRVAYADRCQISAYLQADLTLQEIARRLGFSKSTISREISRNSENGKYFVEFSHKRALERKRRCRRKFRIKDELIGKVDRLLRAEWSPQQIAGRLLAETKRPISPQTIYSYVNRHRKDLGKYLRRFGRRGAGRYLQRKYRESTKTPISKRPAIVARRVRIGDWERDGMYAGDSQQLLIHTDRKSRFVLISKMKTTKPKVVTQLTHRALKRTGKRVFTVTNDNGPEFRDSRSLKFRAFHCDPGCPNQRGSVENAIGLLRQYVTRKTDISKWSRAKLTSLENKLNFRPRKCLDYKTPYEVFFSKSVALAIGI